MASKALVYEQLVALAEQPSDQVDLTALPPAERRTVDMLRETLALLRDQESVAPPDYVRNRALRLMRPVPQPLGASLVTRLTAVLTFDSQTMAPAAGVRGDTARLRQLLFSAGSFMIDVQVFPQDGQLRLLGQVHSQATTVASGQVQLVYGLSALATELDDLGEFSFDALSPGTYALRLRLHETEIDTPAIVLSV